MVDVIAYRGIWRSSHEQNEFLAFLQAFDRGVGVEIDVRDLAGEIVVSSDPPAAGALALQKVFALYKGCNSSVTLVLNVHSCGLQRHVAHMIQEFDIRNYFIIDVGVPDALGYLSHGLIVYTRHSDCETAPSLYEESQGVWLDELRGPWITSQTIASHIVAGKPVYITSPELRGRPHLPVWEHIKAALSSTSGESKRNGNIGLRTEFPDEAKGYFGKK